MAAYLNQGMYDVVEAARLVGVLPAKLVRWSERSTRRGPLVSPSLDGLYSFLDLISLVVVAQLAERGPTLNTIYSGIQVLGRHLDTSYPLAHEALPRLATAGSDFFAEMDGEWLDVARGWQGAFQSIIVPALQGVEYGADRMASIWRPARRVSLNPRVQAGAACIEDTRIPTALVFEIIGRGETPEDVAADYDLEVEDVLAAQDFEVGLRAAA